MATLPGLQAKLEHTQRKIEKLKATILENDDDDLTDMLKRLTEQKRELLAEIEQEKIAKSQRQQKPELEFLTAAKMLANANKDELETLQYRIKGLVSQIVSRMDLTFETFGNRWRKRISCEVQLTAVSKLISVCAV